MIRYSLQGDDEDSLNVDDDEGFNIDEADGVNIDDAKAWTSTGPAVRSR